MPRWPNRLRPSLPRTRGRGWVQPGNVITRALDQEVQRGLPPHLPAEPAPVPGPVISSTEDGASQARRPSSAA